MLILHHKKYGGRQLLALIQLLNNLIKNMGPLLHFLYHSLWVGFSSLSYYSYNSSSSGSSELLLLPQLYETWPQSKTGSETGGGTKDVIMLSLGKKTFPRNPLFFFFSFYIFISQKLRLGKNRIDLSYQISIILS